MHCSGGGLNLVTSDFISVFFLSLIYVFQNNMAFLPHLIQTWRSFPVWFKYMSYNCTSLAVSSVSMHSIVIFLFCCYTLFNCLLLPPLSTYDVIYCGTGHVCFHMLMVKNKIFRLLNPVEIKGIFMVNCIEAFWILINLRSPQVVHIIVNWYCDRHWTKNSEWVWSGNTTITNRRQPCGTTRRAAQPSRDTRKTNRQNNQLSQDDCNTRMDIK